MHVLKCDLANIYRLVWFGLVWFGLVYLFIQPATDVALDMSIQFTAKECNKRIRYGHLSTIINLGQLKQCYSYIKI